MPPPQSGRGGSLAEERVVEGAGSNAEPGLAPSNPAFSRRSPFPVNGEGKSAEIDMTCLETYLKTMIDQLLAGSGVSISDLKKNPTAVIEAAGGFPIAVLNRNTPAAYLVPAKAWEELMDRLEDIELAELVRARAGEVPIPVSLDEL